MLIGHEHVKAVSSMSESLGPLRTVILDVPFLPRGGSETYRKLSNEQRTAFASKLNGECFTCLERTDSTVRYMALEEDDESESFQSIVGWSIPIAAFQNFAKNFGDFRLIDDVRVHIFQNDLAIAIIKIATEFNIARDSSHRLKSLELSMSSYSREVVNLLNVQLGNHYSINDKSHWELSAPGMLWSSRIFIIEDNEFTDTLFKNLSIEHRVDLTVDRFPYFVGEGNSLLVVQDDITIDQFLKVFNVAQLFYAYNDQLCKQFKNMYDTASKIGAGRRIDELNRICNKYSTSLSIFHIAFDDAKRGLQGKRKKILQHIVEQWDLNGLRNSALAHSEFVTTFINGMVAERARRNQSTIEAGVVFLAGVSVLQFFLEFWDYSDARPDRDPFRLMHIARSVSVEFFILGTALILGALAYARKSIK